MSSELWLKLVEHEYFTKKLPHQYGRLKERFEEFKRQGELDQTISPEKMAEIIIDFIKKEDERKEAEEEKASKRREKRYMKLVEKRINDQDLQILCEKINAEDFDCIVCLKRSGWIVGVYLSNQKTLPLFTVSEIKSIPNNFERILVVDDKICTGKSFNRAINKLPLDISVKTAVLYVESDKFPDIWIKDVKCIHGMWYEK